MRLPLICMLAAMALTGCRYGEKIMWAGGGAPMQDTGSTGVTPGDDGGDGSDTGGSGYPPAGSDTGGGGPGDTQPPTVLDLQVSVEEYPDIGWVAEMELTYIDPDDDIDGGRVLLNIELDGSDPESFVLAIDDAEAVHNSSDGTVFFALEVPDSGVSGSVSAILEDANGNRSEPYGATL